ncbi:MAG: hypothetical protein ACREC4_02455 [Methylocella sp.]
MSEKTAGNYCFGHAHAKHSIHEPWLSFLQSAQGRKPNSGGAFARYAFSQRREMIFGVKTAITVSSRTIA